MKFNRDSCDLVRCQLLNFCFCPMFLLFSISFSYTFPVPCNDSLLIAFLCLARDVCFSVTDTMFLSLALGVRSHVLSLHPFHALLFIQSQPHPHFGCVTRFAEWFCVRSSFLFSSLPSPPSKISSPLAPQEGLILRLSGFLHLPRTPKGSRQISTSVYIHVYIDWSDLRMNK